MNKKAIILGATPGIIPGILAIPKIIDVLNNYIDLAHPSLNGRIILILLFSLFAYLSYYCLRRGLSIRNDSHYSKNYCTNKASYSQTEHAINQIHKTIVCQNESNHAAEDTKKYPSYLSPKIVYSISPPSLFKRIICWFKDGINQILGEPLKVCPYCQRQKGCLSLR
jgi:hypothetical protein